MSIIIIINIYIVLFLDITQSVHTASRTPLLCSSLSQQLPVYKGLKLKFCFWTFQTEVMKQSLWPEFIEKGITGYQLQTVD